MLRREEHVSSEIQFPTFSKELKLSLKNLTKKICGFEGAKVRCEMETTIKLRPVFK